MQVKIKNIGPIVEAEIALSNINVISGANDSGKSTIGKILFSSLVNAKSKLSVEIADIFVSYLRDQNLETQKDIIIHFIGDVYPETDLFNQEANKQVDYINVPVRMGHRTIRGAIDKVYRYIVESPFEFYEKYHLYEKNSPVSDDDRYTLNFLQELLEDTNKYRKAVISDTLKTEYDGLYKNIMNQNSEIEIDGSGIKIKYKDTEELFYENEKYTNVIYYEPKMDILSDESIWIMSRRGYQFGVNRLQKKLGTYEVNTLNKSIYEKEIAIVSQMFTDIGLKSVKKGNYQLDNKELPLKAVATGIKNLLGLREIVENGLISRSTLFIIDEPELSLHPVWQVKYIEILKKIEELFKVDIIIVTHSNYIVETVEKKFDKNVNYYLASRVENNVAYENCNNNTNKIYNALGVAYEYIDSL